MNTLQSFAHKTLRLVKTTVIYILMFTVLAFFIDYWRGKDIPKAGIPAHAYTSITGEQISYEMLSSDKVTVLYFWATWCGPCKATTPSVKQLSKHFHVVSVAVASGNDQTLKQYATENTLTYPIINDSTQDISNQWNTSVTPFILFLKNGEVVGHTTGISAYPGLLLRAWLASFS